MRWGGNCDCGCGRLCGRDLKAQAETLNALATLKPLGQLRDSFILAANDEGLWIIDQHVAHERVLFEKILREREVEQVQRQRLLMPVLVDLLPAQMVAFAEIARELELNGFEAEPFGPQTLAIKAAPVGLGGARAGADAGGGAGGAGEEQQTENAETRRAADRGLDRVPRGDQGEYAAGREEDRVVAGGTGQDGASDELPAWAAYRFAVFS